MAEFTYTHEKWHESPFFFLLKTVTHSGRPQKSIAHLFCALPAKQIHKQKWKIIPRKHWGIIQQKLTFSVFVELTQQRRRGYHMFWQTFCACVGYSKPIWAFWFSCICVCVCVRTRRNAYNLSLLNAFVIADSFVCVCVFVLHCNCFN